MKKFKYAIFSPKYDENCGGIICLHKLCHTINELGHSAYLLPLFKQFQLNRTSEFKSVRRFILMWLRKNIWPISQFSDYKLNPAFNTPVINHKVITSGEQDDWIVVYPEITLGNPLNASNVVRWLLYNPGVCEKAIVGYNKNELYFKIHDGFEDFTMTGSQLSNHRLTVSHWPLQYYNEEGALPKGERDGTAYCIRKAANPKFQHDVHNSILIDGMSHQEISSIFKRVKQFISYDSYTAYSKLAALCGCESIVIPKDDSSSKEDWHKSPEERYGIAYGFEDIDNCNKTKHLLQEQVILDEKLTRENVEKFIRESCLHFSPDVSK